MSANVVALVGHTLRNVAVRTRACEEDAEVANGEGVDPSHQGKADDAERGVENEEWASNVILPMISIKQMRTKLAVPCHLASQ